jgi:hypothetical protein
MLPPLAETHRSDWQGLFHSSDKMLALDWLAHGTLGKFVVILVTLYTLLFN